MGIVGDPPSPFALNLIAADILLLGILDFIKPEMHIGSYALLVVSFFVLFEYVFTHNDKPHMTKWKIVEADGTEHYEDSMMPGGTTIKSLLTGIALVVVSAITWFMPWARLTSLIFIGFGTYACGGTIWVYYELNIKKGAK